MFTINTFKTNGIEPVPVFVECDIQPGVGIHLVGLADQAVKVSLLRTVTAMQSMGYSIPGKKVVINFAPADLRKSGSHYDLPIALAIIGASGQQNLADADKYVIAGELGLDGSLRDIPGWMQAAELAKSAGKACILPVESAKLAASILESSVKVYGADDLNEVVDILVDGAPEWTAFDECHEMLEGYGPEPRPVWDEIVGHDAEKRALEIAAAGGHPILMMGAPGETKRRLAYALREILPPLTAEEAKETQRVYSAAGLRHNPKYRPFRTPWYGASIPSWLGGGAGESVLPGEVSLAHNGVLFVDEFNCVPKTMQEGLRTPLEDGKITISRLKSKVDFPAKFFPVFATNPCPCGYYGEGDKCTCTPAQRMAYLAKLSGPIYDRLTLQVWVHQEPVSTTVPTGDTADVVAERVAKSRVVQIVRQGSLNEELSAEQLNHVAILDAECREFLEKLFDRLSLPARSYTRILRIARTIADLDDSKEIMPQHLMEAASYRFLDRREF